MESQLSGWNLFPVLDFYCKRNSSVSKALSKYLHKQIWSPKDREDLLETLGSLFIELKDAQFGTLFRPILLDVVMRGKRKLERNELSMTSHRDFCISLSHCLYWPDIRRFTLEYVRGKPSFTKIEERTGAQPKRKKLKKNQVNEEAICRAAWLFACYLGDSAADVIPLEDMLPYLSNNNDDVRWFACQAIMDLQKIVAACRNDFLRNHFTTAKTSDGNDMQCSMAGDKKIRNLKSRYSFGNIADISHDAPTTVPERVDRQTHTQHLILETDLCDNVTCVGGVVISKTDASSDVVCLDLLPVPSNETNLHSLALAVSSGSPVLLQGVVGSGKTTLVEHLARLTGRAGPPQLMKIQLGDQMDSKALLGTYRCTEVPGEFIWQPGVLTQAVTHGYWVLLEDIDYAPMEVISVLLPLLETSTLSVPGHGDTIKAAPGFHLFATQRLVTSSTGWQRQQTGTSMLLDKLWTTILVEPLSRTELFKVLCTKYPQLETVMDKLLDIYFLLSAGDHHQGEFDVTMETDVDSVGKFLTLDGRLISTRDLMTWCCRIAKNFDIASSATANLVFQEAVDGFVACLSKSSKRMPLAEAIGAKLNITKAKAEYFCLKYKPDVSVSSEKLTVGRVSLPVKETQASLMSRKTRSTFSFTRQSSVLLERVAVCVSNREPVLLVGETGTGKTSSVQYLAQQLGHKLHVINMNQQSDSADLLGGFKPVDLRHIVKPFYEDFELLFCKSFSRKQNIKFMGHLQDCFGKRKWEMMFSLMEHTTISALQKFDKESKKKTKWQAIAKQLTQLKIQVKQTQNTLAFTFMEGSLVKALRAGDWVLLDEINLAAMETLECLSGLLESTTGSVLLMERGDIEPVVRHPDFRLFACMNPATDVGKKDLSPGIRNRFTELYVDELEDGQDLKILVSDYLQGLSLTASQVDGVVKFYLIIRNEASKKLTDGTGHQPHYSLRTLCRALTFAARNICGSVARSLYEGFCLSFLTQLDRVSHPIVEQLIGQHIVGKSNMKSILKQALPAPPGGKCLNFEGFWIPEGELKPQTPENYILTPSVRANLRDLARVVSAGQHPVLIQGETSVGKTSLIKWLAQSSGNTCVRVNNHEHTDLQEYVGCYAADENGKLAFKEGVMVEAMKKGHWIILDELNLAPTDVLEALNRLLDDNRELYIPETQETVKAHPKFMLFATQNPPGHYGGRKMLSRAFRNRFVELHFDEIPSKELETILHERCNIPLSYSKRLIAVMLELQTRRRGSGVFAGKMGFMTLRDLFRWAERYKCPEMDGKKFYDWDKHLADQGYMLLAGRVRKCEEVGVIQEVIQRHFKCKINISSLYTLTDHTSLTTKTMLQNVLSQSADGFQHIVWTHSMRRLAVLIGQAVKYKEPILLVGETGCGKTTMCQMYAAMYQTTLHSLNCHLHTESADFLGGLRPVRAHSQEDKKDKLFEWVDGPLVLAMKDGAMFLIDEISLADDSVLERLNSVLEPERTILLAEKGGGDGSQNEVEQVEAIDGFHVFATMNPGGDFGKKELSPALRNRFTEIWCPPSNQRQDLVDIIEHNLHSGIHLCNQEDGTSGIGPAMMDFVHWFTNNDLGKRCTVSIRDILTWVRFINKCSTTVGQDNTMVTDETTYNQLDPAVAYIHGACLVFLDGLGAGSTSQGRDDLVARLRAACLAYLLEQMNSLTHQDYKLADLYLLESSHVTKNSVMETSDQFCIPPFSITKGNNVTQDKAKYALEAPGTCVNAQRVLRGLQLPRPLLLEGSPGVGKTSLVGAIARASGRELVRINLSEQTDVSDLFGADLPVEGAEGGVFAWRDGPLLQALKAGSWIILDELNLASQSVLEGLNACLDHRAEVYIPELGKTFHIQHEKTRLFACQNPLNQGGGRKGLPRSFLNRFTQVFVEALCEADLMFIAGTMYPDIPKQILTYMVKFNMQIHEETVVKGTWGQRGSPWEFNLRDVFRWCDLLLENQREDSLNPGEYVGLVYADRMRTTSDKQRVYELYSRLFPEEMEVYKPTGIFHCGTKTLQVGHSFLNYDYHGHRQGDRMVAMEILHHSLEPLESLMKCVEMNWMTILVGPPSSGKSSIVEMLSRLTGHQLNILAMNSAMDTTELLGGFEQADLCRHIEEIAADVGSVVQLICQQCLLLANITSMGIVVTELQTKWRQYIQHQISGDQTSSVEELDLTKKQVSALLAAIVFCEKIGQQITVEEQITVNPDEVTKIAYLRKQLESLRDKLALAEPGKGGGAFKWVDSLLVKSLKLGEWLLIDNVNFCSASVLDRLNALLEPNGVLSINERGVIDGEIPTIKPHPNFRLFFAMDPKQGEISRAMRNRGVEIYMPGEDDGKPFSDTDLHRIFISLGLKSKQGFYWLKHLHNSLKDDLPRGDKPNIQHLLQVAQNVVYHSNHGYSLEKSVWMSCHSVYVQRQRHAESKQVSLNILTEHFGRWSDSTEDDSIHSESDISSIKLPSIMEMTHDPVCATICKNAAIFTSYMDAAESNNTLENSHLKLKHSLSLLLNLTSADDMHQTVDWLQHFCADKTINQSLDVCKYVVGSLQDVCKNVVISLTDQKYKVMMEKLGCESLDHPIDIRWNPQILDYLLLRLDVLAVKHVMPRLDIMLNRLHVEQMFQLEMCLIKKYVSKLEDAGLKERGIGEAFMLRDKTSSSSTSGSESSASRRGIRETRTRPDQHAASNAEGSIHSGSGASETLINNEIGLRMNHPATSHLVSLYPLLRDSITEHIAAMNLTSYDDVAKVLEGISYMRMLFEVAVDALLSEVAASHLCLFWRWFESKTMCVCCGESSGQKKLLTVYQVLREILNTENKYWSIYVKFLDSFGCPYPLGSEQEAEIYTSTMKLQRMIELDRNSSNILDKMKVKVIIHSRQFLNSSVKFLLNNASSSAQEIKDQMEKMLLELRGLLKNYGLCTQHGIDEQMETDDHSLVDPPADASMDATQTLPVEHVQLWPLFEHSTTMEYWRIFVRKCRGLIPKEDTEVFCDFASQFTPMMPAELNFFQSVCKENEGVEVPHSNLKNKQLYLQDFFPYLLSCVLVRLRKCTSVSCPSKWLGWNDDVSTDDIKEGPSYDQQKSFHHMAMSSALYTLLSRADSSHTLTTPSSVKLNAPLKSYSREITQLSYISRHVWCHAAVYADAQKQSRALEKTSFFLSMKHTLQSLKPLVPSKSRSNFEKIMEPLSNWDLSEYPKDFFAKAPHDRLPWVIGLERCLGEDMQKLLTTCIDRFDDVAYDSENNLALLGKAWIDLGLLGINLLAPKGPVDPEEKSAVKLTIMKKEMVDLETELEVLCKYHRLVTGQQLTDVSHRLIHPRIPHLLARKEKLAVDIKELTDQVAYRPTPSQYDQLVTDIQNYISSIASVENVHHLAHQESKILLTAFPGHVLDSQTSWIVSQDKFVDMLQTEYLLYEDITTPFLCALNQMVYGMHLVVQSEIQGRTLQRLAINNGVRTDGKKSLQEITEMLENVVLSLGKFPTVSSQHPTCSHLVTTLTVDRNLSLMEGVCPYGEDENDPADMVLDRVLNSCLNHVENEARTRGELTNDLAETLTRILDKFVKAWQQEEQKKRDKEEMEASLYRFKSQVHGDERSENEILEAEFQDNFPQFQKDFQDLVEPVSLEDTSENPAENGAADDSEQPSPLQMSDIEMTQIFSVHQQLYRNLVTTDWYQPISAESLSLADWIKPVLSVYNAASTITRGVSHLLGSDLDSKLLGGHMVVSAVQQYYIVQDSQQVKSPLLEETKVYDIYHDSNVPEVIQCLPVLHNLTARVHDLQQEWPDHPTLKQLCEIVERIQSFPITAPVIKFLTGIELLLQKAQDWESNASQHVSMATQLSEISQLIVQWRKLELSCWTSVLDSEAYRYRTKASRWWFHLYELMQSALQESGEQSSMKEITNSLKQFVEQASLGDFHVRLQMLLSFHCQLATMATSERQTLLMSLLWNMFQFYSRFSSTIQTETDKLRSPIEKELKGFVKIARWSDINYWALKQATEKTHRTLHKHIKQFQVVLHQPVKGILGDTDTGVDTTMPRAEHSTWAISLKQYQENLMQELKGHRVSGLDNLPAVLSGCEGSIPLQCRLSHLSVRYNKHWTQVVSTSQYSKHLVTLDTFIGDVIEEVHELQSLEINRSVEKEKQRSEAKHQNLKKRKALSDLFKYLTKLGLSYRKGLTMSDTSRDEALLVPPLDLSASTDSDEGVQGAWEGCLQYYYKCVSRMAQFGAVIGTPSKELGIGNLERCRGFTEHLFQLLVDQHTNIANLSTQYRQIRSTITDMDRLVVEKPISFPQEKAKTWMSQCKDLVVQQIEGLNQFLVVLHSCPRQQGDITLHPSPYPLSDLHKMALVKQGDEILTDTITTVKNMLQEVQSSQKVLHTKTSSILLRSDLLDIQAVFKTMSSLVPRMEEICKLFNESENPDCPNAFTEVLHFLYKNINEKSSAFNSWFHEETKEKESDIDVTEVTQFSKQLETLVSNVLMVVQRLNKHHVTMDIEGTIADQETDEVEDEIQDGHLMKMLLDKLHQDKELTDCTNIAGMLSSLVQEMVKERDCSTSKAMTHVLHRCVPLVHQYRDILHHQLVSNIATERIMGKMLSVLLRLFTDLAIKGFCIPPELSDEMEGEGATDFCDIEDGGIGEGEGVKNVSDQIEDEDQLDDAKRPEDRKEEDTSNQPDVKSEENAIEMSEDFDGKTQDLEDADKQEQDEDDDDGKDEELDKQMGDVDEQGEDKLDEQMWGSDEEEEGDSKEDEKEESGPGDGKQSEPELVAKDDNEDKTDTDGKQDKGDNDEDTQEENNEEQKPHNLDQLDQDNYDDDQVDPYHGKNEEEKQAPEDMDLPDDLNLDDNEAGNDEGETEETMEDTAKEDETKLPPEETPEQTDEQGEESEEGKQETTDESAQEAENSNEDQNKDEVETEENKEEEMETDVNERQEEEGRDDPGFNPQDEVVMDTEEKDADKEETDPDQAVEHHGKTSHDAESVEQSDTAQDQAGQDTENNQQEMDGTGQASSEQVEGHQGQKSTRSADTSSDGKRKKQERQPGKSDTDRSLGSTEQKYKKLKTTDNTDVTQEESEQDSSETKQSDTYEHVKDSTSHHDTQTLDVATADQQDQQDQIKPENEEADSDVEGDVDMADSSEDLEDTKELNDLSSTKLKKKSKTEKDDLDEDNTEDTGDQVENEQKYDLPGDNVATAFVGRGPDSTIHTALEHLHFEDMSFDLESLRAELEDQLGSWNQTNVASGSDSETAASDLWHRYEALTSSLSQDLCEQLRLVLEPTQATKLKGDYRTGKRLNMRKVIPYIASQFRKDKIWLRRTKPSKRQYQVMLAIDDSSSMVDNHSKQIAFESLALISNALTLLEAGQISICSFGETVNVLHSFTEQFTSQSGAHLLQYLTFEQKKTKIAQLLKHATKEMLAARQQQQGSLCNPETSQLLLMVSDGRGLFMEGMEVVKTAVRQAREANVFLVFVIIDNPVNKDSILDIKVPVFKPGGQIPEIKSYMDSFPFPFYIILRDINSLPIVLSDALRQWFELVTAVDI